MRQVVLDTETTGMPVTDGHRIIEIGCVEILNRETTKHYFHQYVNPEREVDMGAYEVHGISNEFLADKPVIANVLDEFLDFVRGSELIIHNARFDVGFLNAELEMAGYAERIEDICDVVDTVSMARKKYPGARVSLDALVKRFNITSFNRDLHGALLDSEILAQVYLMMTGGQSAIGFDAVNAAQTEQVSGTTKKYKIATVAVSEDELLADENYFKA